MELKPGYKQTDVGVIPDDWGTTCFKDSFDFLTSATYSRAETSEIGHICYVHYGDIHTKWNHFIDFKKQPLPLVSEAQAKNYPRIKDGDLVMADASEDYEGIGKSVEVKNLGNKQAISGLHTFLLRDKKGVFASFFKGYIHSNPIVKKQFDRLATGLKVFGVSRGNLKVIEIPLPTKAEQEAIAGALSDADELIASLEQLIEKKRMIKQGAIQELLTGKKRLPGFQQKPGYKQTEVGKIPEDWEVNSLDDLGDFKNGLNKDKDSFGHGSPFVNLMDVFGVSSINSSEQLGLVDSSSYEQSVYSLKKGDVLFIRSSVKPSGVGLTALIKKDLPYTVYSGFLIRFRSTAFKADKFKEHCFYEKNFRQRLINSSSVSANTNINQENLGKLCMALPPTEEEQEAIATVLSDMDTDIEALKKKLEKARKIKAGMMHNLLTGTIRLV